MHTWIYLTGIKTLNRNVIIKDIKEELKCGSAQALAKYKELVAMIDSGEIFKDYNLWYIVNTHFATVESNEQPPEIYDYWTLRKKQEDERTALVELHFESANKWYDTLSDTEKLYIDILKPAYQPPIG
jgi:hypothetical protein